MRAFYVVEMANLSTTSTLSIESDYAGLGGGLRGLHDATWLVSYEPAYPNDSFWRHACVRHG